MKKVNNESIKRLSKNKIKNYFHILFGIILLVISLKALKDFNLEFQNNVKLFDLTISVGETYNKIGK